jgi:hypothetical protein
MRVLAFVVLTLIGRLPIHAQTQITLHASQGWNRSIIAQGAGPQTTIDYDRFWQQDEQGRLGTFNVITPENRAELVRTQIERWLVANQQRLTPEQIAAMRDFIAFAQPDVYRIENRDAYLPLLKELEQRADALFTLEDMRQALTIHGTYIPLK